MSLARGIPQCNDTILAWRIAFISDRHSKRPLGANFTAPKFSVHRAPYGVPSFSTKYTYLTNNDYPCNLFNHCKEPQAQAMVSRQSKTGFNRLQQYIRKSNGSTLQPALQQNNGSLRRLCSFAIGPKHPEFHNFDIPRLTRSRSTLCSFACFDLEPTLIVSYSHATCGSLSSIYRSCFP